MSKAIQYIKESVWFAYCIMTMELTRRFENIIEVEEVMDIQSIGVTCPVRCRLANGIDVVVKYMRNPFGQQVLVNEFIGSCIADLIGLTVPEYGICNLLEEVILNSANEDLDESNAGLAFFSKEYPDTVPPIHTLLSRIQNKETEKIILFDHLVNNFDRHEGNLLVDMNNMTLFVIDNSHIFTKDLRCTIESLEEELKDEVIFSTYILETNKIIYDSLCNELGFSEDRIIEEATLFKSKISQDALQAIKDNIPITWIESVGENKINKIFEILNKKVSYISEIGEMIIKERRNK